MGTFVAGYLIVWFAVVLSVARLGRRQRQLRAEYEALRAACQWSDDGELRSKAA
jgi:CcmD family protein